MTEFVTDDGIVVTIRLAKLEDAPSLQRNCLPSNTLDEVKNFLKNDFEEMEEGNKFRLVADVSGAAIGNLELFFSRHPLTFHTAEISTVVVNPKFGRKGIATKMIESALKLANRRR